ncbi:MAG: c-type cytochrome [Phycisphaeraceae bacterium]|nr:MAG: c-type cytochrome [Phycisphaeraceae bacterium]
MSDPNAPKTWTVGGTHVMRSEDFQRQKAAEMEAMGVHLGEVTQRYIEAQAAYFEALRAIPHGDLAAIQLMPAAPGVGYAGGEVAAEPAKDELTDHNYDGIEEYDNPTPGWWYLIFYGCVAFSVFYVCLVHLTPQSVWKTRNEHYAEVEAAALKKQFSEVDKIPMGDAKILKIMAQPSWLAGGQEIFDKVCYACHGKFGEGMANLGPNMHDDYYKPANVQSLGDIAKVIKNGAGGGAMPPGGGWPLSDNEIALVAAYMASMRDTPLPEGVTPKAPEGEKIAPWPTLNDAGEVVPAAGAGASAG